MAHLDYYSEWRNSFQEFFFYFFLSAIVNANINDKFLLTFLWHFVLCYFAIISQSASKTKGR